MEDNTLYGYTLAEHEYTVELPKMYAGNDPTEPTVTIAITAHGGGTVGQSYAHNGWDYAVYVNGTEVINGDDLSSGSPATHADMARTLASFLANDAEAIAYIGSSRYDLKPLDKYDDDATAFLEAQGERLSLFAADA